MHLGALTTQASPRNSRQSGVVAVLQIVTHYVDSTPRRVFSAPLRTETGRTRLPNGRRQREPAGRSPAPKAPARQSEANAAPGRITGGGGRGGVTKPYHAAHPRPAPQHPRQHKPFGSAPSDAAPCRAFFRAPVAYGFSTAATCGILAKLSLSAAFSRASSGLTLPAFTSFSSTESMLCMPCDPPL